MLTSDILIQTGAKPQPGVMQICTRSPNPAGQLEQLYVLKGDAVSGPVKRLVAGSKADIPPANGPDGQRNLRVLHFNDLHNNLTDLSGDTKGTRRFSQMVKRVNDARAAVQKNDALLFLSIGDDHTGTGFDELLGWSTEQFVADASYRAYSAAGVDCSVLGNHEIDRGTALLARGIEQDARFPILSANVHSSFHLEAGRDYFPAAIAVCNGLRIAMIGLTTRVETKVGQPNDLGLAVASPVEVISNILPAIEPHVDVVLILSHCGYGDGQHRSGKAAVVRDIGEADFAIARAAKPLTDKPLFVLGAHTHTVINNDGLEENNIFDGVPVLQAGAKGQFIGELALDLSGTGDCEIRKVCLHAIKPNNKDASDPEQPGDYDAEFENAHIKPLIDEIEKTLTREIAKVTTNALSFEDTVLDRYAGESALINFMCDAIHTRLNEATYKVDICLLNGATVLSGVEPGSLSLGAWFDVMPYPDQVFILTITGKELETILNNNAKRILRPEEIEHIDYHDFLPRGYFHSSKQLRYTIDLGNAAKDAQATGIEINGTPIAALYDQQFKVAMPTYLALGAFGERWNGQTIGGGVADEPAGYDLRQLPATNTGLIFRNQISAYILSLGGLVDRNYKDGRLTIHSAAGSDG